ncbi:hypothetical protein AYO40_03625 [Planctomycetaceae bacterium SCGC AG-212-D15]|nr:hypothetical protein AYO40_03625 [Planctomycetaceae bacterium SCGC AG-212-D15]
MCGRFTMRSSKKVLMDTFRLESAPELPLRYNVAPTQPVATVRQSAETSGRELALMRWGLIPAWAKEASVGNRLINARAETVADKPAFRNAFRQRRCLIIADGFYEWCKREKSKQAYLIHRPDDAPFAFAGLWEKWRDPEGQTVQSCSIITTDANAMMRPLHDRMPVILRRDEYDCWLDPAYHDRHRLLELLRPCPEDGLSLTAVGSRVNNARNEGPECVEPARDQLF